MRASWDAVKITFLGSYLVVVRVLNFDIKCKNELLLFFFQFALINLQVVTEMMVIIIKGSCMQPFKLPSIVHLYDPRTTISQFDNSIFYHFRGQLTTGRGAFSRFPCLGATLFVTPRIFLKY